MRTSVMAIDAGRAHGDAAGRGGGQFGKAVLATGANVNILRVDGSN